MMIKHICFDLDGTIVNSFPTIYKCTLRTLRHFNIPDAVEEKVFHGMIGHHFLDIFNHMNIKVEDIEDFINIYKTYYFDYIDDSLLYPDTEDVLGKLKSGGTKISLLTTKGQDQAELIIDHFRLNDYFDAVYGRRPGIAIKPAAEPLLKICSELSVPAFETLMTGDSDLDIRCGKNAGTLTCAVTYGYRTADILKSESPDFIINSLPELISFLKQDENK